MNHSYISTPNSSTMVQTGEDLDQIAKKNYLNTSNNNNDAFQINNKQHHSPPMNQFHPQSSSINSPNSQSPHLSLNSSTSNLTQQLQDFDHAANENNTIHSSPQTSFNSSFGSNLYPKLANNSSASIASSVPGGVITTQNMSTVIRPKDNNNSLQFVKIQTPELSKKAVEQIRIAQETRISKDKIKEVEEEWQNNLLNWKSKRRQQFSYTVDHDSNKSDAGENCSGRKIKTFAEMIEERAKSGNRLKFNLQRYVETEEEEAGEVHNQVSGENQEQYNQSQESKTFVDSDNETHSSTSSGYNQTDPKSRCSVEEHQDVSNVTDSYNSSNLLNSTVDKILGKKLHEKTSSTHSISMVNGSEQKGHNSALKQGMRNLNAMSIKEDIMNRAKFDETKNKTIEQNDSSSYDEDEADDDEDQEEQEEEEQRQLQRIAFEAKLKAFERLTQPSHKPPKLVPKNVAVKTSQVDNLIPNLKHSCSLNERYNPPLPPPINPLKASQNRFINIPAPVNSISREPEVISGAHHSHIPNNDTSSPPPPLPPPPPSPPSLPSTVTTKTTPIEEKTRVSDSPSIPLVSIAQNQMYNVNQHDSCNKTQSPLASPKTTHKTPTNSDQVDIARKLADPSTQPSLPATPKNQVLQKRSVKEDKDQTVLSVSGKKRCSSCKEELGRGAAAFVVESLSLVYHTNCFRCSVCHVNLSNGFRGVDVRVHAGALHCQNCYSKDGLNYSRV